MDQRSFVTGFVKGARDLGKSDIEIENLWKMAAAYPPFQEQFASMSPDAPAAGALSPSTGVPNPGMSATPPVHHLDLETADTLHHLQGIGDQQHELDSVTSQLDLNNA